jgi:hypothetical protein
MAKSTASVLRAVGQAALGAILVTTGTGHLTNMRKEFQAQATASGRCACSASRCWSPGHWPRLAIGGNDLRPGG